MTLSKDAVLDLEWWRDNIIFASKAYNTHESLRSYTLMLQMLVGESHGLMKALAFRGKTVAYKCS